MDACEQVAREAVTALEVAAAMLGEGHPLAAVAAGMRDRLEACVAECFARIAAVQGVEAEEPADAPTVAILDPSVQAPVREKPHGRSEGMIPKAVRRAKRLRLVGVSADGRPTGYVDEGTAAELANRNRIAPSTIYRIAGTDKVVNGFCVERITE